MDNGPDDADRVWDVEVARVSLAEDDLAHALKHLGAVLQRDPRREDALALLDDLAAARGDGVLDHLPGIPAEGLSAPDAAVVAYLLGTLKRLDEAAAMLAEVMAVSPDTNYLDWVLGWDEHTGWIGAMSARSLHTLSQPMIRRWQAMESPRPAEIEAARSLARLSRRAAAMFPHDDYFPFFESLLHRKLGDAQAALSVAQAADMDRPTVLSAVAMAMAYKALGRPQEAVHAYRQALKIEPDDMSARHDIVDLLWDMGELTEALRESREIVQRRPNDEWGLPTFLYLMHVTTGGTDWRERLDELSQSQPENARARYLAAQAQRADLPYVRSLPPPSEASIRAVRNALECGGAGDLAGASLTLTAPESPSAYLAIDMHLRALGVDAPIRYDILSIPDPDPRVPLAPVERPLWEFRGGLPVPAVSPPSADVQEAVAAIARSPYNLHLWQHAARAAARGLGAERLDDLLGVMVHPPTVPADTTGWDWLRKVQVAGALIIGSLEGPWEGSERRSALLSLAYGPMDWTAIAAVVALSEIALADRTAAEEIQDVFVDLLKRSEHAESARLLVLPLTVGLMRLPNASEIALEAVNAAVRRMQA